MYDLIGDIHGYAEPLKGLLDQLGYRRVEGGYRHPERQVIFLGDFIDRGPAIGEVLEIVRGMVEQGAALAVMGNHELNALAYHTPHPDKPGEFLRPRVPKNIHQHEQTVRQLTPDKMQAALAWFRTLPLWLDLPGLRVVHACWDSNFITQIAVGLKAHGGVSDSFLRAACTPEGALFKAVEDVLKGKEILLPEGMTLSFADGVTRNETRVKWYLPHEGETYRTYALTNDIDSDLPIDPAVIDFVPYAAEEKPVFIGHYWLRGEKPELLAPNVCCLDYSVAKDGFLCAYRWDGESRLSNEKFVW